MRYSHVKNICHQLVLLVSIIVASTSTYASRCDFLPPGPQPEWTFDSSVLDGYYVGVGLAEEDDGGPDVQIDKARQQAIADLASSIEVSVRSSLKVDIRERRSGDNAKVEQDLQQLTETITDTSLKEVQLDSTWLDRKRCIVWVRVKIARSVIEARQNRELQTRKLALLDELYDRASEKTASVTEKNNALDQAYILFGEIDFDALEGVTSKTYYQRLLDNLGKSVRKSASSQQQAETLSEQAEKLLVEANNAADTNTRKSKTADAVKKLKQIIAINPVGESDISFAGEAAAFKIAEVEKGRNNSCEAQFQYEVVRDRTQSDEWKSRASQLAESTKCTRTNKKDRAWRKNFDGVPTTYLCARDIAGAIDDWGKPCENIQGFLNGFGSVDAAYPDITSEQLVQLAYRLDRSPADAGELKVKGRALIFVSKGKITTRQNAVNPSGQDYQFSGHIYSYVIHDGKLVFKDKYTGTGGWNPVSEELAIEVIGLNVAKRWKQKYLQQIRDN